MNFKNATTPYNNAIGKAFEKRGVPLLRILKGKSAFQAGLGERQRRFIYDDINSSIAKKICNNKNYTKYLLDSLDFPTPHGIKLYAEEDIEKGFSQLEKPLVVKPISEMWGKGVTTGIETVEEAKRAYAIAKEFKGKYVIMEEHVEGSDHRILILGGKFIAGLKRSAPFVIGDGQSTIEELIQEENKKRKASAKIVKKILIDKTVENFLNKAGLSLNSILPEGKKIQVRMTGNICSGGISENITDQVHPSVISTCQEIAACFDLDLAGIDILTTDISRPLEETGGKISEVNQNPDIVMHTDPYSGEPIDTARMFTEYLFPTSKDAWIDINFEGKKIETQLDLDACLTKIPRKILMKESSESGKIITIENPAKPLFNYLLNKLTVSVDL